MVGRPRGVAALTPSSNKVSHDENASGDDDHCGDNPLTKTKGTHSAPPCLLNAPAKLRANPKQCERSELLNIARQIQRS